MSLDICWNLWPRRKRIDGIYDIGGSEVLCYRDSMTVIAEELGLRQRWLIPVPLLTPRPNFYLIHLVSPLTHNIAKCLTEGLKNPVVSRDDRITALVPQKLLGVRESTRAALQDLDEHRVETNWSMAGAIPGDADWAGGSVLRDVRHIAIDVPASATFGAVFRVGGRQG